MWVLGLAIDCFKDESCLSVIDRQGFYYQIVTINLFCAMFYHINQVYTNNSKKLTIKITAF